MFRLVFFRFNNMFCFFRQDFSKYHCMFCSCLRKRLQMFTFQKESNVINVSKLQFLEYRRTRANKEMLVSLYKVMSPKII